jgi:hypothetical protein
VSIDTLHAGHLSCYGYGRLETPHLDRPAEEGVLFENAVTTVPLTLPAHASIFTGRNPLHHGVVDHFTSYLGDEEETLAEVPGVRNTIGEIGVEHLVEDEWGWMMHQNEPCKRNGGESFSHSGRYTLIRARLETELRRGPLVISYNYTIPGWLVRRGEALGDERETHDLYLYVVGKWAGKGKEILAESFPISKARVSTRSFTLRSESSMDVTPAGAKSFGFGEASYGRGFRQIPAELDQHQEVFHGH